MADASDVIAVRPDELQALIARIFAAAGAPEADAATVAEVLVEADLRGVESHGATRVAGYVSMIRHGLLNPRPKVQVLRDTPSTAMLGEIEWRKKAERELNGIPLSAVVHRELETLAGDLRVPFDLP